jgi:hypothetical protein
MVAERADVVVGAIDPQRVDGPEPPPEWRVLPRLEKTVIGRRAADGVTTVRRREPAGCLLYGPYWQLPSGGYRLSFRCRSGPPRIRRQPVLGVEVIAMNRVQLAWLDLTAEELQAETGSLNFLVPPELGIAAGDEARLEFRFLHLGNADLTIAAVDLYMLPAEAVGPAPASLWRLLGRLEKAAIGKRTTEGVTVRRTERAGCVLEGGRPFLQLPRGYYRLSIECRAGTPQMPPQPVLGVEVTARRRWAEGRPSGWRSLLGRAGSGGAQQAWRDFTVLQLNSGSGSLDFTVPAELSLDGGQEVLFGFRLLHLGNADLSISAVNLQEIPGEQRFLADTRVEGVGEPRSPAFITRKTNVIIVGNCQAQTVYEALLRTRAFNSHVEAKYHFVTLQHNLHELGRNELNKCDILLVQDIRDWETYPLRPDIREDLPIIKFPLLHFASLWPFDHYNGPGDREAYQRESPNLTFHYLDGLLARLRNEIPDPEQRLLAYRSLSVAGVINYIRLHELEKRRLIAMDQQFGMNIGRFILDHFQRKRLFYTTNHPNGQVLAMLLQYLLKYLDIKEKYRSSASLDNLSRLQVPVHPKVAKALGVKWASEKTKYLYGGEQITWETYVRRYIEHYG